MSKSKSKHTSIRVFGQRCLASTFRSPTSSRHSQASPKATNVSLSHFLDHKLQNSSLLPATVQGKSTPFVSPLGLRIPTVGRAGTVKQVEKETSGASEKVIFERFKHTDEEKGDLISPVGVDELENSPIDDDIRESRKRKNPFEGQNENPTVRKHVVVLGGESKFKQKGRNENSPCNKKPRPLYNHYANGRGWWDYDMEGVDNEELGSSEVWEGVGSTSLGGIIDWH